MNPQRDRPVVFPKGLGAPPSAAERVTAFCGHCAHFEVWALGGGGDCHKGHDPVARAAVGHCPDKLTHATGGGPLFDLSE